ncbi:MAG: SGNH/GDSL hydrolase family protein [Thermomicrobiales bacterium]
MPVGVGATRPTEDGWVPLVAAGLPEGTQLLNLGVSGATLADMIADQLPVAVDAAPRWVIWPAPNDFHAMARRLPPSRRSWTIC